VGYAGGTTRNPTYRNLGDHTEALQVDFDPTRVTYADLLDIFWKSHNPAAQSWSRQYRAAIFYHGEEQGQLARAARRRIGDSLRSTVHTDVLPLGIFTPAEDYHQKYYLRQRRELLREFRRFYPDEQGFIASTAAARVNGALAGYGSREQLDREIDDLGISPSGRRLLLDAFHHHAGRR